MKRLALMGWLISGLLVAGCGDDPAEPVAATKDDASAEGDVLEGTISDAMIPLDQLQSQAPAMSAEPDADGADDTDGGGESSAEAEGSDEAG